MDAYPRIDDFLVWSLSWPLIHLILPYPTQHSSVWATGKLGKTCHVSCWNSGVFSLFRVSLAHQCTYLLREETWWVSQTQCQLIMAMLRKFLLEYSCFTVLCWDNFTFRDQPSVSLDSSSQREPCATQDKICLPIDGTYNTVLFSVLHLQIWSPEVRDPGLAARSTLQWALQRG